MASDTFRAFTATSADGEVTRAVGTMSVDELPTRRRAHRRRAVECQLQGRPGDDGQGQGRPDLAADPRHRPRRHGPRERRRCVPRRQPGHRPRVRPRRVAARRVRRTRACAGRLARAVPARARPPGGDDDRNRRLHRGAVGAVAGGARADARRWPRARDRRHRGSRLDRRRHPRGTRLRGRREHRQAGSRAVPARPRRGGRDRPRRALGRGRQAARVDGVGGGGRLRRRTRRSPTCWPGSATAGRWRRAV